MEGQGSHDLCLHTIKPHGTIDSENSNNRGSQAINDLRMALNHHELPGNWVENLLVSLYTHLPFKKNYGGISSAYVCLIASTI